MSYKNSTTDNVSTAQVLCEIKNDYLIQILVFLSGVELKK